MLKGYFLNALIEMQVFVIARLKTFLFTGFLLYPSRHNSCEDRASRNTVPGTHQHVQLYNVINFTVRIKTYIPLTDQGFLCQIQ